tara:strand:+ start:24 stop:296 length:273 start_codon:yes stop_codon:yes gene_type:complete
MNFLYLKNNRSGNTMDKKRPKMTQDKLEYQAKKAFLEIEADKFIDYLCEPRTKPEVYAAIEKIALLHLEIQNCEDIIYTANIPEFDDPLN